MIRRPPGSTRTDTLFPYTTLFRSLTAIRTTPVLQSSKSRDGRNPQRGDTELVRYPESSKSRDGRNPQPKATHCDAVAQSSKSRDGRKDRKSTRLNSSH